MLLLDVAERYIPLNIYNAETARAIRTACGLFDVRSGLTDCRTITPAHIDRYKQATLKKANARSFNAYLGYLKLIARWGSAEEIVDADYILKLRKAPEPQLKPKAMKRDELQAVLASLQKADVVPASWFWIIVIRFFYSVGLRRRQLVEVNYEDVDWNEKTLTLSSRGSKTLRTWEVPLTDIALKDLEVLVAAIEAVHKRPIRSNERLFNICYFNKRCTPDPKDPTRMRPDYITKIMGKVSARTGITIGAHRLRHTTATALCNPKDPVKNKPDIFFAQHVLGHTDIRTTRIYVKTVVKDRHAYMSSMLTLKT